MLNIAEKLLSMAIGAIAGATAMWASMRSKKEKEEKEQIVLHAPMNHFKTCESDLNDGWSSSKDDVTMAQDGSSLLNFEEDEIVSEQLTRNIQFFGVEGQRKIAGSFVVVIGLGVSAFVYFLNEVFTAALFSHNKDKYVSCQLKSFYLCMCVWSSALEKHEMLPIYMTQKQHYFAL